MKVKVRKIAESLERRWNNFVRRARNEKLIVVLGSAHKVGSTWLYELVSDLGRFQAGSALLPKELYEHGTILLEGPGAVEYLERIRGFVIFKSHSYPVADPNNNKVKFISIYRDPRDVLVSTSFYLAWLDEKKGGWGTEFAGLSMPVRINMLIEKGDFILSRLEQWFKAPHVCQVRYEDLKISPKHELMRVLDFLGIETEDKVVDQAILKQSFESKSRRKPGDERKDAFLRKGIVGDWRNYFDEYCIADFKKEKAGRWNRLLVEMGYEKSPDWGNQ